MFCYKCGKQLPDDAMFCSACGTTVQDVPVSQPTPTAESKQSEPKPEKEIKTRKKLIIGVAAVIIVILLMSLIKQILFGGSVGDPMGSSDSSDYHEQMEEPASEPTYEKVFADLARYSFEHPDEMRFIRDGDTTQVGRTMQQNYLVSSTDAAAVREQLMWYYMFELIGDNTFVKAGEKELKFDAGNEFFIWFDHADESVNGFTFGVQTTDFEIADCDLMLYTQEETNGTIKISCWFSPNLVMQEGEVFTELAEEPVSAPEPEPTPEPEPQPTQKPVSKPSSSDPSVLPDFLAHDASGKFEQVKAAWADMAVFAADDSSLRYVAENYVQILKDMGYTVVDTEEKQKETFDVYRWYMANSAVNAETIEGNAQIYVKIMYYKDKQHSEITVAYGDGITYGGDVMTGSSGSNDFWETCSACGGDGKCNICNGSDTVSRFQAGIGWVDQNCTSCSGGRCPFCGGTGKP